MNESPRVQYSALASLVALGVQFQQWKIWSAIEGHVHIHQKIRQHRPLNKLLDTLRVINLLAAGMAWSRSTRVYVRMTRSGGLWATGVC